MRLSERFKVQLLKRSWRLGIGKFLKTATSLLISAGPIVSVLAYSRDCRDGLRIAGCKGKGVAFQDFKSWDEIPNEVKKSLLMADNRQEEGFEDVIKRGWRLWIGNIGSQLAIFMWTRDSFHSADFFFPVGEKGVLFWQAETLPKYRGMDLLPLLFDHIAQTLQREGTHMMYATCATYNLASRRVFEKSYFRLIGRGMMRAKSGQGIIWIPLKKVQEREERDQFGR